MPFAFALMILLLASCRSTSGSSPQEAGETKDRLISQSTPFPKNLCQEGGLQDVPAGPGWTFDPRMGCALSCASEQALKADYLQQLKSHRLYGDPDLIASIDPDGAAIARYYRQRQEKLGLDAGLFAKLSEEQLFDGNKWLAMPDGLRPGDILLNMAFGTPNRAGAFYTKRGIAHSALVVHVAKDHYVALDSGSESLGIRRQIPSQTVWLRPKAEFFAKGDVEKVIKWGKLFSPAHYDNYLIDDWKEFRKTLHSELDAGTSRDLALSKSFLAARKLAKPPLTMEETFTFQPKSGLYCSEGVAAIFTYLGFRQYGDSPIELITAFSEKGDLPDWGVYLDALGGFSADSGPALLMHQIFWNYFRLFETGRKMRLFDIPHYPVAWNGSFAKAIEANLLAVEKDQGKGNHVQKQLDKMVAALEKMPDQKELLAGAKQVQEGLQKLTAQLSEQRKQPLNLSQATYSVFMENIAYGPHTFLENKRFFELKGVFYNTDLSPGGYGQAPWVADLARENPETKVKTTSNIATTLYRIDNKPGLPADRCVIAEKLAPLYTGPVDWLNGPEFGF